MRLRKENLADVQLLIEEHDELKTGISVNKMISMEGRDINGIARTPLGAAVEKKASRSWNTSSNTVRITS